MSYIGANAQGLIANIDGGTIQNATLASSVTFNNSIKNGSSSFSLAASGSQTIFTINTDEAYFVTAFYNSSENTAGAFVANSWLLVKSNTSYAPAMASGGNGSPNLTISISGSNVNIGNTTGSTREITATWMKII